MPGTSSHRHYAHDPCQADHDAWLSSTWPMSRAKEYLAAGLAVGGGVVVLGCQGGDKLTALLAESGQTVSPFIEKDARRRTASTNAPAVTIAAITIDVVRLSDAFRAESCAIELAIPREYCPAESRCVPPA